MNRHKHLASRISINILTIISAYLCYQAWSLNHGDAWHFRIGTSDFFAWAKQGNLEFGFPGQSWHRVNAALVILATSALPVYKFIIAFVRWTRRRVEMT